MAALSRIALPRFARYAKLLACRTGVVTVAACCQFIFVFLVLLALPFGAAQSQPAERAPDTMAARVLACASCHGAEGEGTSDVYFPRLAGKPAGYLYNQLVAFRDGRRKYPPMNYLLEFLPDPYLKQMAGHFASLRPPFPAPAIPTVSNEILGRGESLVRNGDPQHGIPPCSAVPRSVARRNGARHPRLTGPARELRQRAAWRLALWHAHGRFA
jgi:cytochrome c553